MPVSLNGHHGTSFQAATDIQNSNYEGSIGHQHWLGDGVYFFVPGVSQKCVDLAEKWAIAEAWDNKSKSYRYNDYCILQSDIETDDEGFLDLTIEDGVEILQYLADHFNDKMRSIGKKLDFYDGLLINLARGEKIFPISVAKGNFYIKFAYERINKISLRTNNCTICAVYDPKENIQSIKVIKTGTVL